MVGVRRACFLVRKVALFVTYIVFSRHVSHFGTSEGWKMSSRNKIGSYRGSEGSQKWDLICGRRFRWQFVKIWGGNLFWMIYWFWGSPIAGKTLNRISVVVMPQGISSAHPAHPWIPKAGSPSKPDFLIKFIQTVVYGCIRKCAHNFYDFPGQRAQPNTTNSPASPGR